MYVQQSCDAQELCDKEVTTTVDAIELTTYKSEAMTSNYLNLATQA
jgi:hypothetical protein